MEPLDVLVYLAKFVAFLLIFIPWSLHVVYRFTQTKWALFAKKSHKIPEKLIDDYDHKFVKLSGVRLHYVEEGDMTKPLLLFVHGFPEFWYSWRYQIKHFAKTHHVVAIDQRGYGDSDKPEGVENYSAKVLAQDIQEVIKQLGHEKAILVGHDWGGAVAWFTALIYPEVVSKLIIMNCPHPGAYEKVMRAVKSQILKSWYIGFFQTAWLPEITIGLDDYWALDVAFRSKFAGLKNQQNFTDEDAEAWKATFSQKGALTPPINYYRALVRGRDEAVDIINRVAKPSTLIIWGEEDPFLAIECAEYSQKMCQKAKVAYVPGSSHWVQQDKPEEVNKIMEEFLN
ncbi:hypothetical protein PMAYCL1PPCAC_33144 [Pristionchus mayeri]|uniref:AB hydrolase-1 domain-containing protein n=1 Tax=Pristionchus mayeri TaxID=1317129 RepID=A0AAN5DIP5_9BILA|nr:hypothetical protein PMAYCL1PPCAC_33144 [Pristionchus mayeri]